jgi:hypothetical protein
MSNTIPKDIAKQIGRLNEALKELEDSWGPGAESTKRGQRTSKYR